MGFWRCLTLSERELKIDEAKIEENHSKNSMVWDDKRAKAATCYKALVWFYNYQRQLALSKHRPVFSGSYVSLN